MRKKYPLMIMAGSPPERDALMEYADTDYKTLIDIEGKPMINYVIDAIIAAEVASYILIVGLPEDKVTLPDTFDHDKISFIHIEGPLFKKTFGGGTELVRLSQDHPELFKDNRYMIMVNGDIPTVTPAAIHDFLDQIGEPDAKFYHSASHKDSMEAKFPDSHRSWIHIKGKNDYCGGDIDFINVDTILENYELIKKISENRKLLVKALLKLSPFFLIKYLLRRISIDDVEEVLTKLFGFESRVIICEHPEIVFDIDKPSQLDMAREYIKLHPPKL